MRMRVQSLASLSGLGIWHCRERWYSRRSRSDQRLLWLWCRLAALALLQPPSLGTSMCRGYSPKKNHPTPPPPPPTSFFLAPPTSLPSPSAAKPTYQGRKKFTELSLAPLIQIRTFFFFFFFFGLFRATPAACGSSQARGSIRAVASDLHHSSGQCQILIPLREARDQNHVFMDTSPLVTIEPQRDLLPLSACPGQTH